MVQWPLISLQAGSKITSGIYTIPAKCSWCSLINNKSWVFSWEERNPTWQDVCFVWYLPLPHNGWPWRDQMKQTSPNTSICQNSSERRKKISYKCLVIPKVIFFLFFPLLCPRLLPPRHAKALLQPQVISDCLERLCRGARRQEGRVEPCARLLKGAPGSQRLLSFPLLSCCCEALPEETHPYLIQRFQWKMFR